MSVGLYIINRCREPSQKGFKLDALGIKVFVKGPHSSLTFQLGISCDIRLLKELVEGSN
ncbi:hypothetical protein [Methanosalsum natronophilum]|uniref:hypothetical protein n=1 Tax=Methanosalsum natronophilum TaxID=768733 RepID=UPI002167A686|nr:hypothetical protein [Methanosalsum natronophilum]